MSGGHLVFRYAIFEGESVHGTLNLSFVLAPGSWYQIRCDRTGRYSVHKLEWFWGSVQPSYLSLHMLETLIFCWGRYFWESFRFHQPSNISVLLWTTSSTCAQWSEALIGRDKFRSLPLDTVASLLHPLQLAWPVCHLGMNDCVLLLASCFLHPFLSTSPHLSTAAPRFVSAIACTIPVSQPIHSLMFKS